MYKIEISEEFKNLHREYFLSNIKDRLLNKKITFEDCDINNINSILRTHYTKEYIQNQHDSFIAYCIKNIEDIAVGDFKVLRRIDEDIHDRFPVIIKLIAEEKFNFNSYNGKKYWEVIVDIFGYNEFDGHKLYEVIKNIVMRANSIDNIKKRDNKFIFENEMVEFLKRLFPKCEKDITEAFKVLNKGVMKEDDFKAIYLKLEKENHLSLTIDNYKSIDLHGEWNAYFFVYETGLRTCPYCNRQYITPILTSSGQTRGTLDHFLPKSKYPYFSMSLCNLVPTCYSCNSSLKGDKDFDLDDINPYYESVDDYIRFSADININEPVYIRVAHKNSDVNSCERRKIYNKVENLIHSFKLEEQYNYHTNQVEELMLKRYIYSDSYISDIVKKSRHKFNISEKQIKEQLIGYTEEKLKINDEPLSKFRRDIVEQLGFFDEYDLYLENKLAEILDKE